MERFDDRPAGGSGGGGRDGRSGRDRSPVASRDPRELARLHEQLPPHAPEAEMSLLGSMLVDPKVTGDVLLILKSGEDFFRPAHGTIFDAMVELYDQHNALDIVQLHRVLEDRKVLESVGGVGYLVDLAAAVPSAANAERYARIVRDKANLRRLIEAAGAVLWDAHHSAETAADVLEAAEQRIYQIRTQAEQTKAESMQDLVMEVMRMVEANEGKLITGVPTGYHDLDEMTHGLQPGEMIILAARPSMGKTAFALNVAEQVAMQGYPVGVFSLEMSKSALVQRLLSARSGVDSQRIRRGMLGREEWDALERACGELYDAPLLIDDTPGITLLQMRAKARRMASSHGGRSS